MKKLGALFILFIVAVLLTLLLQSATTFSWLTSAEGSNNNVLRSGVLQVKLDGSAVPCEANEELNCITHVKLDFNKILPWEQYSKTFYVKNTGSLPLICGLAKNPSTIDEIFKYVHMNLEIKEVLCDTADSNAEKSVSVLNTFYYNTVDEFKYEKLVDKRSNPIVIQPGRQIECVITLYLIPEDAQFARTSDDRQGEVKTEPLQLEIYTSQINNPIFDHSLKALSGAKEIKK